jgi:hypothetical protein
MGGYPYLPVRTKVAVMPYLLLVAVVLSVLAGSVGGTAELASQSVASPAARAVKFALAQRGKPYRWGAEGPGAFDCSGLTWAAWRAAGVAIPRTAAAQVGNLPHATGRLQPGDLVVYRSDGPTRRHVAMVVGRGRMVEALGRGIPVRVTRLRPGYLGAVRPSAEVAASRLARADIPRRYLRLYREAGAGQRWPNRRAGLPAWAVLAAVGKVESDHGRSSAPGVRSGVNRHGCCAGPMQFNLRDGPPSTWQRHGRGSPYDPRDAIAAAARKLRADGARRDLDGALYAYNHSRSYVARVKALARAYKSGR